MCILIQIGVILMKIILHVRLNMIYFWELRFRIYLLRNQVNYILTFGYKSSQNYVNICTYMQRLISNIQLIDASNWQYLWCRIFSPLLQSGSRMRAALVSGDPAHRTAPPEILKLLLFFELSFTAEITHIIEHQTCKSSRNSNQVSIRV